MISPPCRPCRAMHSRWTPCIYPTLLWRMQESTSAWPRVPTLERQYRPCSQRGWMSCLVRHTHILLVFVQLCTLLNSFIQSSPKYHRREDLKPRVNFTIYIYNFISFHSFILQYHIAFLPQLFPSTGTIVSRTVDLTAAEIPQGNLILMLQKVV